MYLDRLTVITSVSEFPLTGPRSAVGNVSSLTADLAVASSIPAPSHTFVEIDYEIISTVILLPSAESFRKDYCQLQAKVCARSTGSILYSNKENKHSLHVGAL